MLHEQWRVWRTTGLLVALVMALGTIGGCKTTCKRMEKDRKTFFSRPPANEDPHISIVLPFPLADRLVASSIGNIKPIKVKVPSLGTVKSYFGDMRIAPKRVTLRPAAAGKVGFRLDLDVLDGKEVVFSMYLDTDVEPDIDLEARVVELALSPSSLGSIKPKLSKDAKKKLGGRIYKRIPKAARLFIPRKIVNEAAGSVVTMLVKGFYEMSKDTLLKQLGDKAKLSFELPNIPAKEVSIRSISGTPGALELLIVTTLPVDKGIAANVEGEISPDMVTVRMSTSAVAELTNWAISEDLIPGRVDKNGKPKKDGEYRMGVAWKSGKKPLKVYLWKSDSPCMRVTLGAVPAVSVKDGNVRIEAKKAEIEDVEGAAFTIAAVKFYALWKDTVNVRKKADATMKFEAGGTEVITTMKSAEIADDQLVLNMGLELKKE